MTHTFQLNFKEWQRLGAPPADGADDEDADDDDDYAGGHYVDKVNRQAFQGRNPNKFNSTPVINVTHSTTHDSTPM